MKKNIFTDLIKLKKNNIKNLVFGTIFAFVSSGFLALLPFLLILVQDNLMTGEQLSDQKIIEGIYFIIGMLVIGGFGFAFAFVSRWQLAKFACERVSDIRMKLFNKIVKISPQATSIYSTTSLNTRLSIDITNYFNFFSFLCIDFIPALSRIIIFTLASFIINPVLALIYIPLIPMILLPTLILTKLAEKHYLQNTINNDGINKIISENVTGIRVVKALNLAKRENKRFNVYNQNLLKHGFKADACTILWFPYILAFIFATFGFLLLMSGAIANWHAKFGKFGEINASEIISFSTYLFLALFAIFEVALLRAKKERAKPSADRIREILHIKDPIVSRKNLDFENGDIVFKNVSFKFGKEASDNVLSNINLKIKKNSTIAIVGPTGSGKSILAKMISRGFDPTNGEILINDKNIKDFKTEQLFKNVSIVFQSKMLFSGTIRENIIFGNENLSFKELETIAEISQAKDFIQNKDNGYDFVLTQKGGNLSGGQQQRLNIARGLAKRSPILILDDSTSALDNITEKKINNNLRSQKNITLIVIAQRINAIKDIDEIIVLEDGYIKGIGNHETLIHSCQTYKKICESQGVFEGRV